MRISAEKFGGIIESWDGRNGWVLPAEEIKHEKASLRRGKLSLSIAAVTSGTTELRVGSQVTFHIAEEIEGLMADELELVT